MSEIKKSIIAIELANLQGTVSKDVLQKARNVKYYKREGGPGNYKYYYTKEEYFREKGKAKIDGDSNNESDNKFKKIPRFIDDYVDGLIGDEAKNLLSAGKFVNYSKDGKYGNSDKLIFKVGNKFLSENGVFLDDELPAEEFTKESAKYFKEKLKEKVEGRDFSFNKMSAKVDSLTNKVTDLVNDPPDGFYEKVAKHFGEPKDDGESEAALIKRIMKYTHGKIEEFLAEFDTGKGEEEESGNEGEGSVSFDVGDHFEIDDSSLDMQGVYKISKVAKRDGEKVYHLQDSDGNDSSEFTEDYLSEFMNRNTNFSTSDVKKENDIVKLHYIAHKIGMTNFHNLPKDVLRNKIIKELS